MAIRIGSKCKVVAFAAFAAVLTWACATAAGPQSAEAPDRTGQCFLASQVRGFQPVDLDTVRVMVGASRVYELQVIGSCPKMDWSRQIGIASTGGSDWI